MTDDIKHPDDPSKPRAKKPRWLKVDDWRSALQRVHEPAQSDIWSDDVSNALDGDGDDA